MHNLTELRKSSAVLPKRNGVTQLMDWVEQNGLFSGEAQREYYVSFTSLEKLGINPSSPYMTPNGIYSYPLNYVMSQINSELEYGTPQEILTFDECVPFAGDADYFNLFKAKVAPLDLNDAEACSSLEEKIRTSLKLPSLPSAYRQGTPGFRLWSTTMFAINDRNGRPELTQPVQAKRWANLFRHFGVAGVVDSRNQGIIHDNEPTQAVFFSSDAIQFVKRFVNHERDGSTEKNRDPEKQTTTRRDNLPGNEDFVAIKKEFIALTLRVAREYDRTGNDKLTSSVGVGKFLNLTPESIGDGFKNLFPNYFEKNTKDVPQVFVKGVASAIKALDSARTVKITALVNNDPDIGKWSHKEVLAKMAELEAQNPFAEMVKRNANLVVKAFYGAFQRVRNIEDVLQKKKITEGRLNELRASSAILPRKSAVAEIWDFAEGNGTDDYFVTFTSVDKVGINPGSMFTTPIGIYTYPLAYVIRRIKQAPGKRNTRLPFDKIVPFAGNSQWVNIVRSTGNLVDLADEAQCDSVIDRLIAKFGKSMPDSESLPSAYLQTSQAQTMWSLSMYIARGFKESPLDVADDGTNKESVRWNAIFRSIGVDGVSDSKGKGIIHPNEPYQAVFFHTRGFDVVKRIPNSNAAGSSSKVTRGAVKTPDRYKNLISSEEYTRAKQKIISEVLIAIERTCASEEKLSQRAISNQTSYPTIKDAVKEIVDGRKEDLPRGVKPEEFILSVVGSVMSGYTIAKLLNEFASERGIELSQAFKRKRVELESLLSKNILNAVKSFYFKAKK